MPWMVEGVCVYKKTEDGEKGEVVKCHNSHDEAVAHMEALYANSDEELSSFLYVDLAQTDLKTFDGVAAGSFTDMRGRKIKLSAEEFPEFISNTLEVLESTRTESGELVGLPIDADNHDHKGGAGWIKGLALDGTRSVITHTVEWTDLGKNLIQTNARRFYSPTIDLANKVIMGGSLTNWPATRDKKGRILLRPIELSSQIQEIDMDETLLEKITELGNNIVQAIKGRSEEPAPIPKEIDMTELTVAELMQTPEAIAELERLANERAEGLLKAEQLKTKVAEFTRKLTTEGEYGLAIKADDVASRILALPEAEKVMELLSMVADAKIANFAERGHGGKNDEEVTGGKLPEPIQALLQQWVDAGKEAEEFFAVNPELGQASDYDLSAYKKEK